MFTLLFKSPLLSSFSNLFSTLNWTHSLFKEEVGVKKRGRSRRGETLAVLPSPLPLLIAVAIVPRRCHCFCHRRIRLGNSAPETAGFGVLQRNARRYFVASPPSTITSADFCFPSLNDLLSLGQHRVWKCMAVSWSGAKKGTASWICVVEVGIWRFFCLEKLELMARVLLMANDVLRILADILDGGCDVG